VTCALQAGYFQVRETTSTNRPWANWFSGETVAEKHTRPFAIANSHFP